MASARLADRSRRLARARLEIEAKIAAAAQAEFDWLWLHLLPALRALEANKPKTARKRKLRKQFEFIGGKDLWDQFTGRMESRLRETYTNAADMLGRIESAHWARLGRELNLVPVEIVALYEQQLGRREDRKIKNIPEQKRIEIGQITSDWYNTPGETLEDLTQRIREHVLSETRAQLIGITETTWLNSSVTDYTMEQLDIDDWWWQTRRDEIVCTRDLIGPDGETWAGCRALHGQRFKRGQAMPPNGSHPGCRCDPVPAIR